MVTTYFPGEWVAWLVCGAFLLGAVAAWLIRSWMAADQRFRELSEIHKTHTRALSEAQKKPVHFQN